MTEYRLGDGEKAVNRGGSFAALTSEYIFLLRKIVAWMLHATLDELAAELDHLCDVRVCIATILRTLRVQDIVRSVPARQAGDKSVEFLHPSPHQSVTAIPRRTRVRLASTASI